MRQIARTLVGALVVAGCATTSGNGAAMPWGPSSSFSTRELSDGSGHVLLFTNDHDYPVEIQSLSLRDCQNIRGGCQMNMPVSVRAEAGQTVDVLIVMLIDPSQPFLYKPFARSQQAGR
jgi:hypothetical protein